MTSKRRYLFFASELYALAILRPLQRAIRARGDACAWFLAGNGAERLRDDEQRLLSVEEVKVFTPHAVFVPGNWVPDFFPGLKVQVFHGFHVHKRREPRGHFRVRGFFDLYCTQGPHTTIPFQALAAEHRHFEVVETGWPKMDPIFDKGLTATRADRPTVLYTSTFTASLSSAPRLPDTVERLANSGRWRWLVTFHPKMNRALVERYRAIRSEHLQFIETDDLPALMMQADIMLSDTSSAVSEFLLLNRPVVTFCHNKPGPYLLDVRQAEDIEDALATALSRPAALMAAIEAYGTDIHPYRDGQSSERVLDATEEMLERGTTGRKRKPINLWRKIQARQRLNYYRWR